MPAGIVDQDIDAPVIRKDFGDGVFPCFRLSHIQLDQGTSAWKFSGQFFGLITGGADTEADKVFGRFVEKRTSEGLAEAAVCAGDEDNAAAHATANSAAMASSLQPTTLATAVRNWPCLRASMAAMHCQAAP